MNRICLTLSLILGTLAIQAQTNLDSLYTIWQDKAQPDSNRISAYTSYIEDGFLHSDPDSALVLSQILLRFGEAHQNEMVKAEAYSFMGISKWLTSDFTKALDYFQLSLKSEQEIGNQPGIARSLNNIGKMYYHQGNYPKALDYYTHGLKIVQEIGDKTGISYIFNNIGTIYKEQGDYTNALDYYQRSLKIRQEIRYQWGMATSLNNIGLIYHEQGDYLKALDYHMQSLKINEEIGNKNNSASTLMNIGIIYTFQGYYPKGLEYYARSLSIYQEMGDQLGIARSLIKIGLNYQHQHNYPKTLEYCKKSLVLCEEIGALEQEKNACQCLYDTYKVMGKGNEALVYLEKLQVIDDSLNAEETGKKLQQMEFAKQELADSLAAAEETRLVEKAHQEEVRKKNRTRNMLAGGGLLVLILAVGLYRRNRYIKKSRGIISEEKERSENLLLNILPKNIAEELKVKGEAKARDFNMVSILFTDFKDFTVASEKLSAQELVTELNSCFEAFDGIVDKYHIEKIKTIGDAYMCAGGLPVPEDDSVKNTVLAALEMQAFILKRKVENDVAGKPAFEMRLGIHTGPVVAGIVGVKKFQYDVWGDTVNTASRMESNGEVGKVNISQHTYELIKDDSNFTFEKRGKIQVKGKGELEMYFVRLKSVA